jgi:hypothetical protein
VPSDHDQFVSKTQTGAYSQIVCDDCEKSFQAGDDALIALLRSLPAGVPIKDEHGQVGAKVFQDINVGALHRGILTTLFRAHLSPHEMFKDVDLGSFEEDARQVILQGGSTLDVGFDVILRIIEGDIAAITHSPFRDQWQGVNGYRLYFPYVTAYVKVDHQPFDPLFHAYRLRADAPVVAIWRPALSPSELALVQETIGTHAPTIKRFMGLEST